MSVFGAINEFYRIEVVLTSCRISSTLNSSDLNQPASLCHRNLHKRQACATQAESPSHAHDENAGSATSRSLRIGTENRYNFVVSRKNKTKATFPDTIPVEFLERIASIVETQSHSNVINSFSAPKKTAFRVNTLLDDSADALSILSDEGIIAKKISQLPDCTDASFFEDAYWIEPDQRDALIASKAFDRSLIYAQNPSSMLATLVLDPQPGEVVLDLAAAPGGKTLHIAVKMRNEGQLSAVEPVRGRFFKLQTNLKRYGSQITRTYMTDGRTVGKKRLSDLIAFYWTPRVVANHGFTKTTRKVGNIGNYARLKNRHGSNMG